MALEAAESPPSPPDSEPHFLCFSDSGPQQCSRGALHSQAVAAVAGSRVMFLGASFFTGVLGSSCSFLRLL